MKKKAMLNLLTFVVLIVALLPVRSASADLMFPSLDSDGDGLSNQIEGSGWQSLAGGPYITDPYDADSDDDGLTDAEEKLFNMDPNDDRIPGIYVKYEDHFQTRQYFSATDPDYLPIVRSGGRYLVRGSTASDTDNGIVIRRGTTFHIGGPKDATLTISSSGLTSLSPVKDPVNGGWSVAVPPGAKTGTYRAQISQGPEFTMYLKIYVIFELPVPGDSGLSQQDIDYFVYDDDPANLKDETSVWFLLTECCSRNGPTNGRVTNMTIRAHPIFIIVPNPLPNPFGRINSKSMFCSATPCPPLRARTTSGLRQTQYLRGRIRNIA
jgi:hypothetical protein